MKLQKHIVLTIITSIFIFCQAFSQNTTISYDYDSKNQIKEIVLSNGSIITYQYDANGNRTHKQVISGGTLLEVTTAEASQITAVSAVLGGHVIDGGGLTVSDRGIYWGTSPDPEISGTKLQIGSGTGAFSDELTGLTPQQIYYVKAYATNSAGTAFGDELQFETLPEDAAQYSLTLLASPAGSGTVQGAGDYIEGEEVLITAVPFQGWEFVNWTDDDDGGAEVSTDATYNFSMPAYDISLTANFQPLDEGVPENRPISNETITDGDTDCFDATQTITVSDFTVEAGGHATLIAGQGITLLPGTHIQSGGYFHAYITQDDTYCHGPVAKELDPEEIIVTVPEIPQRIREDLFFKVYPNPTDGTFTLELESVQDDRDILVEVLGLLGGRVLSDRLPPQRIHTLSLSGHQPGIYIIRVTQGDKVGVERLIKL